MLAIVMMLIIAMGLNNGITGLAIVNITDTKQIGTTFTSNGEVLLTLDNSPSSITITGSHTGIARVLVNGEEFYSSSGETQFAETKEVSGIGTEVTVNVEVENSTVTLDRLDYTYSQETSEPIPVWNSNVTEFSMLQGTELEIDLSDYFVDDDNLTYLATGASNITVEIYGSVLRVIPDSTFVGERRIKAIASDEYNVVEQQIKIIVTASEENITIPEINITPELNLSENITINITPEINISENLTINLSMNLTENMTINITGNFTENMTINATVNMTLNISSNITLNASLQRFMLEERIFFGNKTIGKKIQDEPDYEVYFTNITLMNESLMLEFYHDYNIVLPVFIEGNVSYTLSNNTAQPNETIKVIVQLSEGIIPRFSLHIGITSEVFEFGKNIPLVNTKIKNIKRMKEMTRAGVLNKIIGERIKQKWKNQEEYWIIDRDDEKLDLELISDIARVRIKGTNATSIQTAIDAAADTRIKTEVFAAEPVEMEEAVITLRKTGRVTAIMECTDINVETLDCASGWTKTDIPFTDDGENITFTVTHFSGYAGADITVLNVQSYPILYGNWTVMFNTTGTANLTVTAVDGTTWSVDGNGTQLQFLEIRCGEIVLNYTWANDSVLIQDYNCSSTGYLTNKELQAGKHTLRFIFGNDTAYAYNDVYLQNYWFRELNVRQFTEGSVPFTNTSDIARGVATDSDRNIIVTGDVEQGGGNYNYIYTVKYDEEGAQLWNATFNRTVNGIGTRGMAVAVDTNDDPVVTGLATIDLSCIVVKYNSAGAHQWNKTFNSSVSDYCYGIATDNSDNVIIAGYNRSTLNNDSIIVAKYNSAGATTWNISWRPASQTWRYIYGYGVATDNNDNIYVGGHWNTTYPFIIKFNSAGTYQWAKIFNQSGRTGVAYGVATDSENNAIIGGYVYAAGSTTDYNYFAAKYNENGTELWNQTSINITKTDVGYGIATDREDNIIITGYTTTGSSSAQNITTLKLNKTGAHLWNATYGYFSNQNDVGLAVATDNLNNVIVAGYINNQSSTTDNYNYALLKYYFDIPPTSTRPILNSTDNSNRTTQNLTVYPQGASQSRGLAVTNITNWYKNGKSIAVLNMPFDTNTSQTAPIVRDYSEYNNTGNVTGATWTSSGISSGAYIFDGTNDFINLSRVNINIPKNFTISAWINATQERTNYRVILSKGPKNTGHYEVYLNTGDGVLSFYANDIGAVNAGYAPDDSLWHYIAVTYNRTNMIFYVDGIVKASPAASGSILAETETVYIGQQTNPHDNMPFKGTIDELRVYDIALSAEQILANNNSRNPVYNTIAPTMLNATDVWHAEMTPNDGRSDGRTIMSNGVAIGTAPTHGTPELTRIYDANENIENITVEAYNLDDIDDDPVRNITNWFINDNSMTLLNLPFEGLPNRHSSFMENEAGNWYFENSTKDFSGNGNDGSCTSCPTAVTGQVDAAYSFDGTDDYLTIANENNFDFERTDSFSGCTWIKPYKVADDATWPIIMSKLDGSAPNSGWEFSLYDGASGNDGLQLLLSNNVGSGNYIQVNLENLFSANKTYHVCFTYNGSSNATGAKLYLNGEQRQTTINKDALTASILNNKPVQIGTRDSSAGAGGNFRGIIDEMHVLSRALSAQEINSMYKQGLNVLTDSFDYSPERQRANVTGASWNPQGKLGGAYSFDGVDDVISVDYTTGLQFFRYGNYTLEAWINTTYVKDGFDHIGQDQYIFTKMGDSASTPHYQLWVNGTNNKTVFFTDNTVMSPNPITVASTTRISPNSWYHIAVAVNATDCTMFVNGQLESTIACPAKTLTSSLYSLELGTAFQGLIDEIRIYNRSLSAEQIKTNYNSGNPTYDTIDANETRLYDLVYTELTPNDGKEDGLTISSNEIVVNNIPTQDTPVLNSTFATNKTTENLTIYPQNPTDPDGLAVTNITNWYENGKSITVLNMPFDTNVSSNKTDKVRDYSPHKNNGTIVCTGTVCPEWISDGVSGGAYTFNPANINTSIIIPYDSSLNTTEQITVEFWIKGKPPSVSSSESTIIIGQTGLNTASIPWRFEWQYNNLLAFYFVNSTGTEHNVFLSAPNETWVQIVGTYDSTTGNQSIYMNGTAIHSQIKGGPMVSLTNDIWIGAKWYSSGPFKQYSYNGSIDEVRVYDKVLTPEQIAENYNRSMNDRIVFQETTPGEVWHAETTPNDGWDDGPTLMSNGLQVGTAPTQNTPILNSTRATNYTDENLTVYISGGTDVDGDAIINITNWYKNGESMALLNLPFEGKTGMPAIATDEAGLWYLDENFKDFSGNGNEGTCTNCPNTTEGKIGRAYLFDGIDDAIELPEPPASSTNITNGSVFAWIKTSSSGSSYRGIVVKQNAYGLFMVDDIFGLYDWGASVFQTTGLNLADEKWHFVGAVFDSGVTGGTKLYVDGMLKNTTTMTVSSQSEGIVIGAGDNPATNNQNFAGKIDEIHLFNRSLNATEVRDLHKKGLDQDNDTIDYSGYGHDAMVKGAVWNSSGIKGGAYQFDGKTSFINLSSQPNLTNGFTFTAWVNKTGNTTTSQNIFNNNQLFIRSNPAGENPNQPWEVFIRLDDTSVEPRAQATAVATINYLNQFVAVSWDKKVLRIFVNGKLEGSSDRAGTISPTTIEANIGRGEQTTAAQNYFNGTIDEVRIYNTNLSAEQILAMNNSGIPDYNKIHFSETEISDIFYAEVTPTDGVMDGLMASTNELMIVNAIPTQTTPLLNSTYGINNTYENLTCYNKTTADINGDPVTNIINWYKNNNSIMILNMPFEGKQGTHASPTGEAGLWYLDGNFNDYSGNENDGSCTNCPTAAEGKVGRGYYFDGINDYTQTTSPTIASNFTMLAWIKPKSTSANSGWISTANTVGDTTGIELNIYLTKIRAGGFGGYASSNTALANDIWYLVGFTKNGTTGTFYLNGAADGTFAASEPTAKTNMYIGVGQASTWADGSIDEIHIFNRSLSATEIRDLYKKGLDQDNDTIDYSGYGYDGIVNGATFSPTGGYNGKGAYQFDGTNDYIQANGSALNQSFTQFTFSAWLNTRTNNFGSNAQEFVAGKMDGAGNRGWQIAINNGTGLVAAVFFNTSSGSGSSISSTNGVINNTWTHIAFVFKAGDYQKIYLNGIEDNTGSTLNMLNGINSRPLRIGDRGDGAVALFNGTIDEVKIYNISLSADQIFALYQNRTDMIHSSETNNDETWMCSITPNDRIDDGLTLNSNNLTIRSSPPSILQFFINSTGTPTRDRDNLTCWANITDAEGDTPLHAYYNWYNNTVQIPSLSGNKSITANMITLLSTIGSGNTTKGEIWTCEARFYDGTTNSSWRNDSARIVEISPTVFINGVYNSIKFNANNVMLKLNEIT